MINEVGVKVPVCNQSLLPCTMASPDPTELRLIELTFALPWTLTVRTYLS